ncbi:hypothetical protein ACK2M2_13690 [Acinetobacter sp. TY1]|uniref:hypothetical protein n=1 Tax=Acinetobacter sp. TY1 TaxID=3387626 RepID=UPI003AF736F5
MKTKILTALLLSLTIVGCQKKPEVSPETESKLSAQFEKTDAAITAFFDKLDSPTTPITDKKQIACIDFPLEYKTNYVPAMLQSEGNTYTREKLLADMDIALDYYKKKDNIQC